MVSGGGPECGRCCQFGETRLVGKDVAVPAAAAMFSVLACGCLVARALLGGLLQTDPWAGGGGDYGLVTAGCGFGEDFRQGLLKKGVGYGNDACFVARHRSADVLGLYQFMFPISGILCLFPHSPDNIEFYSLFNWFVHVIFIVIICLVIVDALLVAFHLMFDLKVIHLDSHLFKVFHYLSIAIPIFFLVEIVLKLYAFRMEFFYRKLEILDAAIVIISFVMDFSLLLQKHKLEGFSFLILLRLWRVASIISGILLSVKIRYEKQVLKMERINLELSRKIQQLESSYSEKEQEIERLEKLLRRNGVLE